ncbi:hypothetical protein ACOSQ2_027449 [Xanthoceras sorbifolium]
MSKVAIRVQGFIKFTEIQYPFVHHPQELSKWILLFLSKIQNPIPNIIDLAVEDKVDEKLKGIMGTSRNSDHGVVKTYALRCLLLVISEMMTALSLGTKEKSRGNHNRYLLVKGLLDSNTSKNTTYSYEAANPVDAFTLSLLKPPSANSDSNTRPRLFRVFFGLGGQNAPAWADFNGLVILQPSGDWVAR